MRRLSLILMMGVLTMVACRPGPAAPATPTRAPLLPTVADTPQPTLPPVGAKSIPALSTPTDEPLATLESPASTHSSAFFSDDFSNPQSGWIVETLPEGSVGYDQGSYVIEVKRDQYTLWSHPGQAFADTSVAVSAQPIDPSIDTEMGVICRYEDKSNFVYASISSDGYYGIAQVKQGDVTVLTGNGKLQPSTAITQGGAVNRIDLVCDGSKFTLAINDQVVDSAQAQAAASGDVGLLAGTFDQPNASARFNDFVVDKPPVDLSTTGRPPGSKVLFQDDFSDPRSGWDVRETENGASGYRAGRYFIRVATPKYELWSTASQSFKGDVIVEVTATPASGPEENEMGVICRYQDKNNFMSASVGADGYYAIAENKDDQTTILTGGGKYVKSDAIPTGGKSYNIQLACEGDTYTLFVNGKQIDTATSTAFRSGDVGLLAGTFDQGNVEVLFDDFAVSVP